jgi:hypothetical protein
MEKIMTPKQTVQQWVEFFNASDIEGLTGLYAVDAVNHQVVIEPLNGAQRSEGCSKQNLAEQRWSAFPR